MILDFVFDDQKNKNQSPLSMSRVKPGHDKDQFHLGRT